MCSKLFKKLITYHNVRCQFDRKNGDTMCTKTLF